MSKKFLGVLFSAALVVNTAGLAADEKNKDKEKKPGLPMEQVQDTKKTTPAGTTKTKDETVVGKVQVYEAGKSIEVAVPGKIKKSRTFDLSDKDITYNVDPNVAVGQRVKVMLKTDDNGHKTLTVEPYRATGPAHTATEGKKKGKSY